ncbi:ABC transporter ATP-binding protein [Oceanispirochaeta sp.]|jgi:NitT/TauT family transport system ATP-binding protein|uniref:ABC transporter ATP-binding protein n=1 Tax=Oceanispirochaeta sp. TaxID=2035350 RepID=UPI00261ED1D3|nr:ABC transporter ATP-binding protein [Oceanispirochaeta sp.]MDA3958427.1 ABC transporter ATP-binding protein [Oceanispirochaeta sp.]
MTVLEARHLHFSYPLQDQQNLEVLRDISLGLSSGEILTLLGPSGCGKSTVLKLLSGFLTSDRGQIRHHNEDMMQPFSQGQMIFQDSTQLFPWLTVGENILFPVCRSPFPGLKPRPGKILKERLSEILAAVGLEHFKDYHPERLSGGMKQRCALGRALMADPEILFMDEPFGSLDAPSRQDLQQLLLTLWADRQFSIVFVTHDIAEALSLSDRIILFGELSSPIQEIPVSLERPRDRQSPLFRALEWELYSSLAESGRTL